MALMITDECINCDVCEPECPNDGDLAGAGDLRDRPGECTECVGHFDPPQCREVCPVDCIPVIPTTSRRRAQLMRKYEGLMAVKEAGAKA